ncbi:MAG: CRISPR-associated endonuclease Cas2 [Hornefia sp.]|nr:CRISPR-associated endonuclease Cas2 [Hornefia sp.]
MRVIVFFDLPTETLENKRSYRTFRKFLLKKGFLMLQESVYCKLTLNQSVSNSIVEAVRKNRPSDGLVQLLVITEKQFAKMEYICGEKSSTVIDSDERLIVL